MCCADPTRTRILFESGTRTRVDPRNALNVLPGPDADPTIIRKWTRTRLGRHRPDCTRPDRHILHSKCYEVNKRCEEKKLFALTTVVAVSLTAMHTILLANTFPSMLGCSSLLRSETAFLIHSLFQLQKYLLSRRLMTNATSQFFFSSRVNFDCYVYPFELQ